jgi:transcriptional regulator with XRE-family HTH domain
MRYFGTLIRSIREAQGKKVKPMATALGVTPTYLRMIEDKKRRPSFEVRQKIGLHLGLGSDWVWEHGVAWPAAWFESVWLVHGAPIKPFLPHATVITGMQILDMVFSENLTGPPLAVGKPTREQIHYLEPLAFVAPIVEAAGKKAKGYAKDELITKVTKHTTLGIGSATIVEG